MRRLWFVLGTVTTIVFFGGGTYGVVSLIAHEQETRTDTVDAAGLTAVSVHNDNGDVEVVGSDRSDIVVVAELHHGLRRTRSDVEIRGDTLVVDADCPTGWTIWCRVDYRIELPADLAVTIDDDNGSIDVRDLAGDVRIESRNGRVDVNGVGGDVTLETHNGSVTATGLAGAVVEAETHNGRVVLVFDEAPTTVRAESSNGSVEVVVPEGEERYRVETDTRHGDTETSVRTDPDSTRTIVAETDNGSVTVRYP